jgi:16S rRNA (guanine1207-N2)-methyltransferase
VQLDTGFGTLELKAPLRQQAWNGADRLLLDTVRGMDPGRILVVNDGFGTLLCALHAASPASWYDSYSYAHWAQRNWQHNQLPGEPQLLLSTAAPALDPAAPHFDTVLMRVPKSRDHYAEQLATLKPWLSTDGVVIVAGMDKHLQDWASGLLARHVGPVERPRGAYKAHHYRARNCPDTKAPAPPPGQYREARFDLTLQAAGNVFGRGRADAGAALILEHLGKLPDHQRVADLGCGDGVLGLAWLRKVPTAHLVFTDDSALALYWARHNLVANGGDAASAEWVHDDSFGDYAGAPFELILCNPPFHHDHALTGSIALRMFQRARRLLATDGRLWVVGNRHLNYQRSLKQVFGNSRVVASNPRFVLLEAHSSG